MCINYNIEMENSFNRLAFSTNCAKTIFENIIRNYLLCYWPPKYNRTKIYVSVNDESSWKDKFNNYKFKECWKIYLYVESSALTKFHHQNLSYLVILCGHIENFETFNSAIHLCISLSILLFFLSLFMIQTKYRITELY